jgi:hypothetical protein
MFREDEKDQQKILINGSKFIKALTKEEKRILKRKKCQWPKCRKRAKFIVEGMDSNKYFCKKHHSKYNSKLMTQILNMRFGQVIN